MQNHGCKSELTRGHNQFALAIFDAASVCDSNFNADVNADKPPLCYAHEHADGGEHNLDHVGR